MKITITGALGSGKSTIAQMIAEKIGLKHYSTGDFMREMASERGISITELCKMAENDASIDNELDTRQKKLGEIQDNFIIDARLGWHFIPQSIKIFLNVSDDVAAKRIFKDKRENETENVSVEATLENIKARRESEKKRYSKLYGIDYYNKENYDFVLDTTLLNIEQVFEKVLEFVKTKK